MPCCLAVGTLYVSFTHVQHLRTSHIWFPLNNIGSHKANHLKFIHKFRDYNDSPSSISDFSTFYCINIASSFAEKYKYLFLLNISVCL